VSYRERIDRWIRFDSVGTLRYESPEDIATEADATEARLRAALAKIVAFTSATPSLSENGCGRLLAQIEHAATEALTQQTKETGK
jgi:hypothetical protein